MTLTFGSLFAGIGGFDLGFERAGMRCLWQVELDDFCQRVLAKHWPNVERFGDVRECGRHNLAAVDVICGGFPCQPFSGAGKQKGEQDNRNLWPEMRRVIAELRPRWVVAENVPGIRRLYLDTVLSDLESLDYTAGTIDLPAVAFGAPHIRHRFFIVAHTKSGGQPQQQGGDNRQQRQRDAQKRSSIRAGGGGGEGDLAPRGDVDRRITPQVSAAMAHTERTRLAEWQARGWQRGIQSVERPSMESRGQGVWTVEPDVGRVADGVPSRVDRLRALGNAIVPEEAEWLGRHIVELVTPIFN